VGAVEGHTGRTLIPHREDVLHREPKVGKRLHEGGGELPLGLQALQGAWGTWDVSYVAPGYVAGSQDVRFCLHVAVVVGLDPPSNDGLVVFF
jgi:hypothetical protein